MDGARGPEGLWLRVLPSDLQSQQRPLGSGPGCASWLCPARPFCVLPDVDLWPALGRPVVAGGLSPCSANASPGSGGPKGQPALLWPAP